MWRSQGAANPGHLVGDSRHKRKSIDTYRAHIAKSINSWCRAHHIDRDKSIFLEAKFFEDLELLRFNPGGPVAQYHSAARGMSILACRSLTVVEAELCQEYKEAAVLGQMANLK